MENEQDLTQWLSTRPIAPNWLDRNPTAKASVERGLQEAAAGIGHYLGSFAQYADLEVEDED